MLRKKEVYVKYSGRNNSGLVLDIQPAGLSSTVFLGTGGYRGTAYDKSQAEYTHDTGAADLHSIDMRNTGYMEMLQNCGMLFRASYVNVHLTAPDKDNPEYLTYMVNVEAIVFVAHKGTLLDAVNTPANLTSSGYNSTERDIVSKLHTATSNYNGGVPFSHSVTFKLVANGPRVRLSDKGMATLYKELCLDAFNCGGVPQITITKGNASAAVHADFRTDLNLFYKQLGIVGQNLLATKVYNL